MDLNYTAEELAFRDEVRGWLDANIPADLREKVLNYEELGKEDLLRWHKILAKKGWVAPAWPEEWGGPGWSVTQRYIFEEECGLAGTPPIVAFGVTMCAQVLLKFGSPEQKKRHLPGIYNGDVFWTNWNGGTVMRLPLGGAPAQVLASGQSLPHRITANGPALGHAAAAFDAARGVLVVTGGSRRLEPGPDGQVASRVTWEYDGRRWTKRAPWAAASA